jgi:hypothetical protein
MQDNLIEHQQYSDQARPILAGNPHLEVGKTPINVPIPQLTKPGTWQRQKEHPLQEPYSSPRLRRNRRK